MELKDKLKVKSGQDRAVWMAQVWLMIQIKLRAISSKLEKELLGTSDLLRGNVMKEGLPRVYIGK